MMASRVGAILGAVLLAPLGAFVPSCALGAPPAAPAMTIATAGQRVSVSWTAVSGASGYTLYYAPYPAATPIDHADMGAALSMTVDLPPGAAYYAAVRARNSDGESGYSNIGTVIIPSVGTLSLREGDYWEYEWSESTVSTTSAGTRTSGSNGSFRVTLQTPVVLGGRQAYPLTVTGDTGTAKPVWKFLSSEGPALLGTVDGTAWGTILGSPAGGWSGAGFLSFFPTGLAKPVSAGTYAGNYRSTSAWLVTRARSSGGCTYYSEVGQNVCTADPSSYSETEYEKAGVGTVGYVYTSSSSFSGGGFSQFVTITRTAELVKSSKVADDGTAFTGTPWVSLPNIARGAYVTGAAAWNGKVYVFGGYWASGGPPWVQSYDPDAGTWTASVAAGAEVSQIIGVAGGSLYAIGRTSGTASRALLSLDAATSRWISVGTSPSLSNPCGAAPLANGNLAVLDCPGTSLMAMYVYNRAASRWGSAVSYTSVVLRPAVAAVGDDVYVMGGYSGGAISSRMRRFRSATNGWENLSTAMRTARDDAAAVAIGGKLYVMGGTPAAAGSSTPSGRMIEVFDTATQRWVAAPAMPEYRSGFAVAALDGSIYVIGGLNSANVWLTTAVRYIP